MSRPTMRTSREAHVYMDRHPCACGDAAFDRQSAVMADGAVLCSRYFGACRTCRAAREFVFELPRVQRPVREEVEFGGSDPSQLLDPGEWLALYEERVKASTSESLDVARAALEEVLKFLPEGAELVPEASFWSAHGRAVRDREPGRFRRDRLTALLEACRDAFATEHLTESTVTWKHTGDAEFPFTAEVGGRSYTLRINDFPAEPLYTLVTDGRDLLDLEDWPRAWVQPAPPKALLDVLAPRGAPRLEGAVRLARASAPGEAALSPERAAPAKVVLEDGERLLALAPVRELAVSALSSERGDEVRLVDLHTGKGRPLAVARRRMLAAAFAPDERSVLVLDEEGGALRYDLGRLAHPASARALGPLHGKHASVHIAPGGRLWLAAAGGSIEVRVMRDAKPVAAVDLSPLDEEVTSATFLPDGRGLLAVTARGGVFRFELSLDHVEASRAARVAAIADAVDAAIAVSRWERYAPRVEVYDERSESGRSILYFVADHYEVHQAQAGSDWAEHTLCTGHATFAGDRRVEVRIASKQGRRLTESAAETYDPSAELATLRAATARVRSSSTVLPGADAIKRAYDAHFETMALPEACLHCASGEFEDNGWDVRYRFGTEDGAAYLDVYATHRRTNDRLYRVHADGRVDVVGTSTEGMMPSEDRAFYAEVQRRFG